MKSQSPVFSVWLICLVVSFVFLVIGGAGHILRNKAVLVPQRPFDANEWIHCQPPSQLLSDVPPTMRQMMISDLVNNVLPGLNTQQVENVLGVSATYDEMRRSGLQEIADGNARDSGNSGQYRAEGHYFDEFQWDLIYSIGTEQTFLWNHRGRFLDPESEYLVLRFDRDGIFESWFIVGSKQWPSIVGAPGTSTYRQTRDRKGDRRAY